MACQIQEHRNDQRFERLPDSQAGANGRHKCCGCAYQQGYDDAINGVEPNFRPDELEDSQAGYGRHKSAAAAYSLGYGNGINELIANNNP